MVETGFALIFVTTDQIGFTSVRLRWGLIRCVFILMGSNFGGSWSNLISPGGNILGVGIDRMVIIRVMSKADYAQNVIWKFKFRQFEF